MASRGATVRPIEPADVPALWALVLELAAYEFEPDAVDATEDDLRRALFAEHPHAFAHVAVDGDTVVGAAVWTVSFSTWTGRHGIHLVDLVVGAAARRGGHGRDLLRALAAVCVERDYRRIDWDVLDALEHAGPDHPGPHGFYRRQGAVARVGWTHWRLDGPALVALGRADA